MKLEALRRPSLAARLVLLAAGWSLTVLLISAVGFALLMSLATAALSVAQARFGALAVTVGTALGGFFDAHAASASALSLVANGSYPADAAILPVLLALSTNTVSKITVALIAGGPRYGLRLALGLLVILTALWLPWLLTP